MCVCVCVCVCVFHRGLYAFHNKEKYSLRSEVMGWPLYHINQEYERQQLDDSAWRVTHFNKTNTLPHLPNQFIVPAAISDGSPSPLNRVRRRPTRH